MPQIAEEPLTQHLAFDDVCRLAADYGNSDSVKSELISLRPLPDLHMLQERLQLIAQLWLAEEGGHTLILREYGDLTKTLRLLALMNSTLSPQSLQDLVIVLQLSRGIRDYLKTYVSGPDSPWQATLETITPLATLEQSIERVIGPDGEVLDSASPELSRLRKKIQKASSSVRSRMQSLVKHYHDEGWLNEDRPSMKAGRLVLPVVSSYKHQVKGVIQDQSKTGITTFIEPYEIIELNNEIKSLQNEELREVERILKELTALLHPHTEEIATNYAALCRVDFHLALTRFGIRFEGCIPEISEQSHLRLKQARNPRLMVQRDVVPLDLDLKPADHTLIITGPNAGGKTVALKTIGLLAIMANSGMPIPALEGSRIPHFDHIFSDIGDQQSLVNDLSTFSAHMKTIIDIQESATVRSLVLLDELGTGTDPAEGAALSRAVLESLGRNGAKTVATTHLGELKVFAYETDGVMNGAMEFDQTGLKPTYRFQAGVPGSSYGFEISRRLGLQEELLQTASEYLGATRTTLENLLRKLEFERQETQALRETAEALERELSRKQRRIDANLAEVKKATKHAERDAARQAQQIITQARQTIEGLIRQIRESQASKTSIKEVQQEMGVLEDRVEELLVEDLADSEAQALDPAEVVADLDVYLIPLAQVGVVVGEPGAGKVYVDVDGKRMKVPLEWLGKLETPKTRDIDQKIVVNIQQESSATYSLDLRGDRFEEARQRIQAFLDRAVLSNMTEVQIIHGKGTGVLKKLVADLLKSHRSVAEFDLGGLDEGGAGVTFVKLK